MSSGSQATLDSSASENIILPILGELDQLIEDHIELFDKSLEIKILIQDFIEEIKAEADLPWVSFLWDNPVKSKRLQIKFELDSKSEYTLLNYYSHQLGRSGMNDATEELLSIYDKQRTEKENS